MIIGNLLRILQIFPGLEDLIQDQVIGDLIRDMSVNLLGVVLDLGFSHEDNLKIDRGTPVGVSRHLVRGQILINLVSCMKKWRI